MAGAAAVKKRKRKRRNHEPPSAVAENGWRYHHLGIPTAVPRPGEIHLPRLKIHVSGFGTSPFGVEWMRFDPDCPVSELVRTVPHIAFEVDDLEAALVGRSLLGGISSPSPGVRAAMIDDGGAPIELIEFRKRAASSGRKRPAGSSAPRTFRKR
jgi:hypothetical protein